MRSVDNLFVFLMTFDYFQVPLEHQGRVLTWGIVGAILMRGGIWTRTALLFSLPVQAPRVDEEPLTISKHRHTRACLVARILVHVVTYNHFCRCRRRCSLGNNFQTLVAIAQPASSDAETV